MIRARRTSRSIGALLFLLLGSLSIAASGGPTRPVPPFSFQSNFWVNLHHFIRSVARGMPAPASLDAKERSTWDAAVGWYRGKYVERDLLFDEGMVAIKDTLREAGEVAKLPPIPGEPGLREILETVAPIYRRHWWPAHDTMNRSWIAAVRVLVERYGDVLSRRVAAAYGETWPAEPHPVDLSVQAGPVGAYTSSAPHTTIASTLPGIQGLASLEILFHEASHRLGKGLTAAIASSAETHHRDVPPQLWHAVLFYNAGELTRRALEEDGYAGYEEIAAARRIYPDLCGDGCRERIAAAWNPYLEGRTSRETAIDTLVASWPARK